MSSLLDHTDVGDMASAVFADAVAEARPAAELWPTVTELGLADLSTPAAAGGSGGTLADLHEALTASGYHGAPGPLVEQDLIANWLLGAAGLDLPAGMRTGGMAIAERGGRLCARRVPWGREADWLVVLRTGTGGPSVALVPTSGASTTAGENLAREPRDTLALDARDHTWVEVPPDVPALLRLRGAAGRTAQMAGAAARVVDLVTDHVTSREQFGRPLVAFQAIQHSLATLLSDAVLIGEAARGALEALDGAGDPLLPVACAKAATAQAATRMSAVGHQLLGAMGVTREHDLHRFTTRLLAWRDEYGDEVEHARAIGRLVVEGGADPWALVVELAGP